VIRRVRPVPEGYVSQGREAKLPAREAQTPRRKKGIARYKLVAFTVALQSPLLILGTLRTKRSQAATWPRP